VRAVEPFKKCRLSFESVITKLFTPTQDYWQIFGIWATKRQQKKNMKMFGKKIMNLVGDTRNICRCDKEKEVVQERRKIPSHLFAPLLSDSGFGRRSFGVRRWSLSSQTFFASQCSLPHFMYDRGLRFITTRFYDVFL